MFVALPAWPFVALPAWPAGAVPAGLVAGVPSGAWELLIGGAAMGMDRAIVPAEGSWVLRGASWRSAPRLLRPEPLLLQGSQGDRHLIALQFDHAVLEGAAGAGCGLERLEQGLGLGLGDLEAGDGGHQLLPPLPALLRCTRTRFEALKAFPHPELAGCVALGLDVKGLKGVETGANGDIVKVRKRGRERRLECTEARPLMGTEAQPYPSAHGANQISQ